MKLSCEFRSFMIVSQPHCGATPVLVYERERGHICRAKVSVTIVSVLHDFMQTHPDTIELNDIGKSIIFGVFVK